MGCWRCYVEEASGFDVYVSVYLDNIYIYSIGSPTIFIWIVYVFSITLYLLYMFRVLFAPIIRSSNYRAQQ
jgi:beta-lactamase regulating signal transducer with metallopeptidase domain